jgi:hypothetical protein
MFVLFILGLLAFLYALRRLAVGTSSANVPPKEPVWTASDLDIPDTVPSGWVDAYDKGKDA